MRRTTSPGKEKYLPKWKSGKDRIPAGQKQKRFVQEYIIDFNATRAAKAAGYSEKTAHVIGHELLKNPKVQQGIRQAMNDRAERTHVTQDKVIKELAKIAFSDMRCFAKWGPNGITLVESASLDDADAGCVSEITQKDTQFGRNVRFKVHDKKSALELLGKHLGMFSDTVKHVGGEGGPIEHVHEFTDETIKAAYDTLYRG